MRVLKNNKKLKFKINSFIIKVNKFVKKENHNIKKNNIIKMMKVMMNFHKNRTMKTKLLENIKELQILNKIQKFNIKVIKTNKIF
jgi:hypothetical protein